MSSVANRYSKALFRVSLERNKIDDVAEDMQVIRDLTDKSTEFRNLLQNPLIPNKKRRQLFEQLFGGKLDSLSFDFLLLLCEKRRTSFLSEITDKFAAIVMSHRGKIPGIIRSASVLPADQRGEIERKIEKMTGKNIVFTHEIDADLLGGFVIRVKDTVIDMSVKGQLDRLKQKLIYSEMNLK